MKKLLSSRKLWLVVFVTLAVLGGIGLLVRGILWCLAPALANAGAASVGIIGGADGPTAIFVTSEPGFPWGVFAGIAAAGGIGIWWNRRHRR